VVLARILPLPKSRKLKLSSCEGCLGLHFKRWLRGTFEAGNMQEHLWVAIVVRKGLLAGVNSEVLE